MCAKVQNTSERESHQTTRTLRAMQPHSRRSQTHTTWNASSNWHSLSPERRPLKRNKTPALEHKLLTTGHMSHPDVYPQDPRQEEDKMSVDRLQKGYHIIPLPMEYESILKNPRIVCQDEISKNAKCLIQIIQKKNELNIFNLDKKRLRECSFVGFLHPPAGASQNNLGPFHKYFDEFAHGKALHQLTKRFPFFNKKEECMDFLYMYKVPIQRAIWFFKTMQVGHSTAATQNKQKKPAAIEQYGAEQTKLFAKYAREFFRFCDGSQQMESSPLYQRWPYFSCILKHAFEEGIVDRHDFLMDICDITNDYVKFSFEKPQIFRMLIIFLSQFVDVITQNAMLSRRIAYLIATRFKIYKAEYDRKRGSSLANIYSSECFSDLVNCQHHRAVVLTMLGLLHAIIIDCPVALVWSSDPFETNDCGSPLDLLPCSSDVLTQHLPKSVSRIDELVQARIAEIKRRSQNIENRWVLNPNSHSGFELVVEVCLNVISVLDKAVLNIPNSFLKLYQSIFCAEANEKVAPDLLVRILLKWAVTTEREGTHRPIVICQLLRMRQRHYRSTAFGSRSLQDILVEYLSRESPTPSTSVANFHEEFANLMHLFYELQRFHLFSHDAYVRALMRCGQFSYQEPILKKLLNLMKPEHTSSSEIQKQSQVISQATNTQQNNVPAQQHSQHAQSSMNNSVGVKTDPSNSVVPDPAIISFIPTSSTTSSSANSNTSFLAATFSPISNPVTSTGVPQALSILPTLTSSLSSSSLLGGASGSIDSMSKSVPINNISAPSCTSKDFALLLPKKSFEGHSFLLTPNEMSTHERFFLHVPIEQTEERRDACNQRAILLYGISDEREVVRQELQKIATHICRIWQKKVNVEFFENSKEVRFKRRFTAEQIIECLAKFRTQTYYDQLVICGWCVKSFVEMICDFINCCSLLLPTSESLDIICSMLETCQNYHGILTLTVELLSKLTLLEKFLSSFNSDCIPGTISCQLAYVLVGYLAGHYYYFLHSAEAPVILNGFYRLIEKELCADGYPITGWARAIAAFIFHAKNDLMNSNLCSVPLLGSVEVFHRIFPESGAEITPQELKYNPRLLTDFLQEPRRFYSYHEYKMHLPSIEDAHTQYSFVVNAFLVAKNSKRDFTKLAELSNICGHISAEKQLAGTWCVAIQELCYASVSKNGYSHLVSEINVDDLSTHYSISTFVLLLASKYCFSCHALLTRLLNNVFMPFIKSDSSSFDGSEMGLCLALEIVSSLICGTDMPFLINGENETFPSANTANGTALHNMTNGCLANGVNSNTVENVVGDNDGVNAVKKPLDKSADERALNIIKIRELDACIFQILSSVCILTDAVKRKLNASNSASYRLKRLLEVLKCSFLAICEQEWVIKQVFRICESTDMESFNCSALKHNSLGQQLLRIALRRKSERTTKQQLMVCNGNSKKSLLDKLLSAMSLWNMRATYYDLKLMIKEISPDGIKHATQQAIAADALISEIGKCCRDLFLNCRRDDFHMLIQPPQQSSTISFEQINCYWLISPLINVCPKPENIPQSFTGSSSVTVKAKFLKEAAAMLDTNHDNSRDRLQQSARLLSQQPFVNLILTCTQGEDLDNLINALLRHIQLIINKAKENPTLIHQNSFALEREGLLLRLNLVGGIFDSLLVNASTSEPWAIALFQLMFYEIISSDKDNMMAPSTPPAQGFGDEKRIDKKFNDEKRPESRARFSAYNSYVKKIKKELGERNIPPELNCLAQLLPISKSTAELNAWESFSSPQKSASASKTPIGTYQYSGVRIDQQPHLVQRHLMRLLHHSHYTDVASPGVVGGNTLSPDIFLSPPSMERISTDLYVAPYVLPKQGTPIPTIADGSSSTVTVLDVTGKSISGTTISDNTRFNKEQSNMQSMFSTVSSTPSINTSSIASSMGSGVNPMFNHPQHHSIFAEEADKINQTGSAINVLPGFDNSQQSSHNPTHQIHSSHRIVGSRTANLQQSVGNIVPKSEPHSQLISSTSTGIAMSLVGHNQHSGAASTIMPQQVSGDPLLQNRMFGTAVAHGGLIGSHGAANGIGIEGGVQGSDLNQGLMGMSALSTGISSMSNMNQTTSGMHPNHAAAAAAAGFLSDSTSRSGSSTPTTSGAVMESPRTSSGGGGRGGRRKNTSTGGTAGTTAQNQTSRGQKRKKDQKAQQPALQSQNPMTAAGTSMIGMGAMTVIGGHSALGTGGQPLGPSGLDMPGFSVQMPGSFQHISQQTSRNAVGIGGVQSSGIQASHIVQQQQYAVWQQQIQQQQMQQHGVSHNFYQQSLRAKKQQSMPGISGPRFIGDQSEMMGVQSGGVSTSMMNNPSTQLAGAGGGSGMFPNTLPNHNTLPPTSTESKHTLQQKLLQKINNQNQQNPHHPS